MLDLLKAYYFYPGSPIEYTEEFKKLYNEIMDQQSEELKEIT